MRFDPDFDHAYIYTPTGIADYSDYLPTVENNENHDVLIDGVPFRESTDWHVMTGHTGQYGYDGPVMHPSELWGQWAINDLQNTLDNALDDEAGAAVEFAIVEVIDPKDEDTLIGWAVLYRVIPYTTHMFHTSRMTGTMACKNCHLLPLDYDDLATPCPGYYLNPLDALDRIAS